MPFYYNNILLNCLNNIVNVNQTMIKNITISWTFLRNKYIGINIIDVVVKNDK